MFVLKTIVLLFLEFVLLIIVIFITYLITTMKSDDKETGFKKNVIRIKYLSPITEIAQDVKGDWIDLRSSEKVDMKQGEYRCIKLGVAMELPKGYSAIIAPRSSTFKRYGVLQTNSIGVIDHSYCGNNDEWAFPVYATRDTTINFDDRICQFRLVKNYSAFDFETVDNLYNQDRGGFGSTGYR